MSNLIYSILPKPDRSIVSVHPDITVGQCVEIMVSDRIGALVVTDDDNLLGIISERDIIMGLEKRGGALLEAPASDILWADVVVLKPMDTIETAMAVMTETKRRHILVAEEGKLLAIISIGDLLCSLLSDKSQMIKALENYIHH